MWIFGPRPGIRPSDNKLSPTTRAYNGGMRHLVRVALAAATLLSSAQAQTPQPFPRPVTRPDGAGAIAAPMPARDAGPAAPARDQVSQGVPGSSISPASSASPATPATPQAGVPTQAELGFPVYPAAQFLASYDAGKGQRYYIFGTTAAFAEIVNYYRTQLNERGNLVFREPPTHMFEVGRFREETMAFPPGVTVKDWTWGGSGGYFNPKLGAQPARFPTVIMFVPPPTVAAPPTASTAPGTAASPAPAAPTAPAAPGPTLIR